MLVLERLGNKRRTGYRGYGQFEAFGTVKYGMRGPGVSRVQESLVAMGFTVSIDGIFGTKTLDAVKAFQRAKGLTVDGIVGPATWAALLGKPIPVPTIPYIPEVPGVPPVPEVPSIMQYLPYILIGGGLLFIMIILMRKKED